MGNVKLSITTAAMIFDVWCCFWMNRLFCFDVFNYKEVYGPLQGCVCVRVCAKKRKWWSVGCTLSYFFSVAV